KRNLLDKLDEVHDFELPGGMVEAEFDQIWAQLKADLERVGKEGEENGEVENEEETQAEYRSIAERRVKLGLILAEIGQHNTIDVSQEDLGKALQQEVAKYPGQEKQIYDLYNNNPQLLNRLRAPLFEDKVVDFILELANVTEAKITREELFKDPDEPSAEEKPKKTAAKRKTSAKKKNKD
ncbi:MAG: trigger factor, partial [Gammaproteobacteria bacterium]